MINKKLINNLYKNEIGSKYISGENCIYVEGCSELNKVINIYEIANKCIEQAEKLGYTIIAISDFDARHDSIENYDTYYFTAYVNMNLFPELNKREYTHLYDTNAKTRQEAIISAFEWILDNKD